MFDFSFGEMLVVAVVALVVLGPERLPKAARFAGLWMRKARAQWYSVKSELEQELASEELKRSLQESRRVVEEAEAEFRDIASEAARARDAAEAAAQSAGETVTDTASTATDAAMDESLLDAPPAAVARASTQIASATTEPAPSPHETRGGAHG